MQWNMGHDHHYMHDINDRLLFVSMLRAGCACRKQRPNDLGVIMARSTKKLQVTRVEREFFIKRNVRQKNCKLTRLCLAASDGAIYMEILLISFICVVIVSTFLKT